jgi:hypothetical protein
MVALPEELIENLQNEVPLYEKYLKKVAFAVLEQNISNFPIFIAHREPQISMGRPVVVAELMQSQWSVNASLLEEFATKRVIEELRIQHFKSVYKDPKEYACFFVISGKDAGFAFYKYRKEAIQKPSLS